MAEVEILKLAASLGGGALVAAIVLVWKRADDRRYADALEGMINRQSTIIMANTEAMMRLEAAIGKLADASVLEERILARMVEAGFTPIDQPARPSRRAAAR